MNFSSPLARRLAALGTFDLSELARQKSEQQTSLAEAICTVANMKPETLQARASQMFHVSMLDLSLFDSSTVPVDFVNENLVRKHRLLPIAVKGKTLFIATADPTDFNAFEDYEFNTGMQIETVVARYDLLDKTIDSVFDSSSGLGLTESDMQELDGVEADDGHNKKSLTTDVNSKEDDAPIIVYINKILMDAIKRGASDLHFEPYEKRYRIRFRVDGVLHEIASPPVNLESRIAARIKVMSHMDLAEKRKPQDGRIKLKINAKKSIDFRVSTLPTLWGEKIVMRILDSSSAMLGIDVLGYEPEQKKLYLDALAQPQGMILVTGPTGSGKTVSLYTGLNILNTAQRNISTAEDPVEINLEGINQVQINMRADMTFSNALRPFCVKTRMWSWWVRSEIWKPQKSQLKRHKPVTWCFQPCIPIRRRKL